MVFIHFSAFHTRSEPAPGLKLFDDLQENACNFSMAGSSQANESINNSTCSKIPKRVCYSKSASGDQRFSCAVNQKNFGAKYVLGVIGKLEFGWSQYLEDKLDKLFDDALKIYQNTMKPEYKKRRVERRNEHTQLRNQKEAIEGPSYESNMALFDCPSNDTSFIQELKK